MQITLNKFTKIFDGHTVIPSMDLTVEDGEMLALLGPSGCGKSTTLFAVCGIHRIDGGQILFGDKDVSGLPSQKRNVGVVFQNYALYPHMTVAQNIAFPLEVRGDKKAEITRAVGEIAELTHIGELLSRRPAQLSGGQQQRVALARAMVRRPDVLLLDEPLANLDAKLRLEMRSEIRRIQLETGITAILVTHDQVEAMSMCDRIAIMDKGRIQQIATPEAMYNQPKNRFIAGFLGNPPISFVEGIVKNGALHTSSGMILPLPVHLARHEGREVAVGIRPEHFGNAAGPLITGRITFIEPQGRETLFDIELTLGVMLRAIRPTRDALQVGDEVSWPLDLAHILAFDAEGNAL